MIELRGKRALVTGGSRGVGAATAVLLAEVGADVGIGYHSRQADAETVVKECAALGVRAFAQAADVSTPEGAEELFARALREFDGVDLFIGNSGIWPPDDVPIGEMTDEQWARTMRQNTDSIFFTTRAAARQMSPGGRIVLVSSTAGQRGEANHADYAASKGAVISFTKSLSTELAPRGITVNCVAPGWIDTEMAASSLTGDNRGRIERSIPIGRIATARDVAGPIVFLCSEHARHVTGEVLNVNGGTVLCG